LSLKVLITGAAGFVGYHLIDFLNSSECMIFGAFFPEKPENFSCKNFIYLDVRSEKDILEVVKETHPDQIFHLAAISSVKHSWEERKETIETNLIGTFNLFEALRKSALNARVLYISTSDVYGISSPTPNVLSEDEPLQVVSPYAFTKACGELLSTFYAQFEDLDIIIARSFHHTGPRQSSDFVCSDWAYQIARIERGLAEPVIKVGNIEVRRDISDVRDVVRAYILLMEKGKKGEVYNVCSGKAVLLKEILDILISYSSEDIEIQVDSKKMRKVDIPFLLGDNKKIKKDTSWHAEIPLKKTLLDLLEYWRKKV